MKFYIASDIFSEERQDIVRRFAKALRFVGADVYVPQEHDIEYGEIMDNKEWAARVFAEDVAAIDACDTLLYICEGMTGDIGAAWECGYAYAKGKKISVHEMSHDCEDCALCDKTGKISLMVAQSTDTEIFSYQT